MAAPAGGRPELGYGLDALRRAAPHLSAHTVVTRPQLLGGAAVLLAGLTTLALDWRLAVQVAVVVATAGYLATMVYKLVLIRHGLDGEHLVRVSEEEARAVPDADLPVYTVLVPAYREPEVIGTIIASVADLDYPIDRLDVRLLLEEDDEETIAAAREAVAGPPFTIVLVPPSQPRTKPKACTYGLIEARGELVTIYDAEDRPEPLQLRRAALALWRLDDRVICVQARLGYFNAEQNLITRWFTIEYGTWFRLLLPGLVSLGAPVPLGGTSNHFRTHLLRHLLGWDPFNVTEDADLGMRLARSGYRVGVLDSVTAEEANSDLVNWLKQRSRWYKGYVQTWLVHVRNPVRSWRELGWRGSLGLHLFVLGTPLTAVLNPVFWLLALIWYSRSPGWVESLFPGPVYYVALLCFVFGNAAVLYTGFITTRVMGQPGLLWAAVTMPVYWAMMAVAAIKAFYQLVRTPSYWEKTTHGLAPAQARRHTSGLGARASEPQREGAT